MANSKTKASPDTVGAVSSSISAQAPSDFSVSVAQNTGANVFLLMASQACFTATSMTFIAFAGLAGRMIAGDPALATLPVSLTMVVVALSTGPLSVLMQKYSRRRVFILSAFSGIFGALVAASGLYFDNFILFCAATLFIGPFQASAQYYRFAAGESVSPTKAPRAISLVLIGGIFAALLAPFGSGFFIDNLLPYTFVGAFIFTACVGVLALVPLSLLKTPGSNQKSSPLDTAAAVEKEEIERPLAAIAKQPAFIAAVVNGALGYAMMVFVMTATPIAMVDFCGFSSSTSTKVISAHVIAMFLPSLFTGNLIIRFGVLPVLLAGHMFFAIAFITALSGIQLGNFSMALIALGLGWNFCYVGGTTLLTRAHNSAERGRVQGLNEMLVFGFSAIASLAAGAILRYYGWAIVNQTAFILLVLATTVTILWAAKAKTAGTVTP